jgi:predicted transcriptional regulator
MPESELLTVRLSPALRKSLDRLARATDRSRSWLTVDALEKYLSDNAWQVEAIDEGVRAADAGDLHRHEDVKNWVRSWGKSRERRRPR